MLKDDDAPRSRFRTYATLVGGAGLTLAMVVDSIAVVGRHIGVPFLGSIELVKVSAAIAASAALVLATLAKRHAVVNFALDRMPKHVATLASRMGSAIAALFFLALVVGSAWIFLDMRGAGEETEVLHIPLAPVRLISIASLVMAGAVFAFLVTRRDKS